MGRLLGLDWPGAVLLGSVYASHTLLAFPLLSRLGVVRNEAVSVTVGATVFTDVAAPLVFAVALAGILARARSGVILPLHIVVLVARANSLDTGLVGKTVEMVAALAQAVSVQFRGGRSLSLTGL